MSTPDHAASPMGSEHSGDKSRDIRYYIADIAKRKRLVVTVWIAVFAAVGAWTARQPNEYEAASTIEYDAAPSQPLGSRVDDIGGAGVTFWMSQEFYQTQNEIIRSQTVAERVVTKLSLQRNAGFLLGEKQRNKRVSLSVEAAARILRARLRVEPVSETRLVRVVVTDQNATRAQTIANAIVDEYVQKTLDDRLGSTVDALNWLSTQLQSARDDLQTSELALHDFKQGHNVLSVSMEDRQNFVAGQIESYTGALSESRERRVALAARVRELRAAATRDPSDVHVEAVDSSPEVVAMRNALSQKRAERAALASRYGEHHPEMESRDREIATIEANLRATVEGIFRRAEADLREIERVEGGLRTLLTDANQEGLDLNLQEIEYQRLSRERENNVKLYNMLLERTAEAELAQRLRLTHVRPVDPALRPTSPVRPRVFVNMLAGLAAGLGLGLLAAIVAGLLDRTVKSAVDIEALGVPVLGFLPFASSTTSRATGRARKRRNRTAEASEGRPELYVHEHPRSVLAECCRTIRTNLAFMSATEELRTLVVTSAGPSEGKTTTSLSIAIAIAQSGSRTIIVDTDLRRPRLHKVLEVPADRGVTSVLIGEAKLEDCIYETVVPGLFVLPSGPIPPNPSELLHTPQFGKLVADLRDQFARVIFDSPPIGVVTDGAVIAPQVDGVIWVARAGVAVRDSVARTMRQVRDVRGRLVGAVLNAIDPGVQSYGSGYYDYQRSGYYLDAPEPVSKT